MNMIDAQDAAFLRSVSEIRDLWSKSRNELLGQIDQLLKEVSLYKKLGEDLYYSYECMEEDCEDCQAAVKKARRYFLRDFKKIPYPSKVRVDGDRILLLRTKHDVATK